MVLLLDVHDIGDSNVGQDYTFLIVWQEEREPKQTIGVFLMNKVKSLLDATLQDDVCLPSILGNKVLDVRIILFDKFVKKFLIDAHWAMRDEDGCLEPSLSIQPSFTELSNGLVELIGNLIHRINVRNSDSTDP